MHEFTRERVPIENSNTIINAHPDKERRPNKENKNISMLFKGYSISEEEYQKGIRENHNMIERDITWVDILYIAAVAATEDKMAMISRYPIKNCGIIGAIL